MPTRIEWTEETWNPVTGCTKVSTGCGSERRIVLGRVRNQGAKMSKSASEIFAAKTEGMRNADWEIHSKTDGGYHLGAPLGKHKIGVGEIAEGANAEGIVFLCNLRDALLEYIRAGEAFLDSSDHNLREIQVYIDAKADFRTALDALTERMEQ